MMSAFLDSYSGLKLLLRLNADRLLYIAALGAALAAGAWLSARTLPVF